MNPDDVPPGFSSALDELWHQCVGLIARELNYPRYVSAVQAMFRNDEALPWPAALAMARAVWRQTPQPALRYGLPTLPATERNAPCPCGSGQKYKKCCLPLEHEIPLGQVNFLPLLLDHLPKTRWSELVGSRIAPDLVWHASLQMRESGRFREICTLLEPWFVTDADFHAQREGLFDALLDAYSDLHRPRKKSQLLARAIAVGDRRMRSAALQRQASMAADRGSYPEAWRLFTEAQRGDPQSPSLSHLEVTLLMAEGRHDEARERARFWVHRLTAMRNPELDDLIGLLRDIASRGQQAMQELMLDWHPQLRELAELLRAAPAVACAYRLEPGDEDAGPLEPTPALDKRLRDWNACVSVPTHSPLFGADIDDTDISVWLPLLRRQPSLWNAFEVLDTVVAAIRNLGLEAATIELERAVLDRGESLLREVLRANHAEGKTLEWGWLQNRPALHLLGERIRVDADKAPDAAQLARLEWLVWELNPNDNQGFRNMLVRAYLQTDRVADALALTECYPDDFAAMQYNRALALFAARQTGAALSALHGAIVAYPKPAQWLLKTDPKPPRQGRFGVTTGGDEEAWIYRLETLALWQQLGAMEWLQQVTKTIGKKR